MSVDAATAECPKCRDSASGRCKEHPLAADRASVSLPSDDFELLVAEDEVSGRKHGPLAEATPAPPGPVWVRHQPGGHSVRHGKASKGLRRHLRQKKALVRTGRARD